MSGLTSTVSNQTKLINETTKDWVESLDLRFQEHISNDLLIVLLSENLRKEMWYNRELNKHREISQVAYEVAVVLFEQWLEHKCGFPCNGHHVAQDYSLQFKDT